MVSDKLGQGFGYLLNISVKNVSNFCSPGASYKDQIKKISWMELDASSVVILMHGDSLSIKKCDLIKYMKL